MTRAATPADVIAGAARWCVVEGDALDVVRPLPVACLDAVVTDPPSGLPRERAEHVVGRRPVRHAGRSDASAREPSVTVHVASDVAGLAVVAPVHLEDEAKRRDVEVDAARAALGLEHALVNELHPLRFKQGAHVALGRGDRRAVAAFL